MIVGFDLDGTLDRPAVRSLAMNLLRDGHQIHIISGCFLEAGGWQSHEAKYRKLEKMGFISQSTTGWVQPMNLRIEILDAVDAKEFDREYRLVDLGLRKGAYIEQNNIEIMFDDSPKFIDTMPYMCGSQMVHVR